MLHLVIPIGSSCRRDIQLADVPSLVELSEPSSTLECLNGIFVNVTQGVWREYPSWRPSFENSCQSSHCPASTYCTCLSGCSSLPQYPLTFPKMPAHSLPETCPPLPLPRRSPKCIWVPRTMMLMRLGFQEHSIERSCRCKTCTVWVESQLFQVLFAEHRVENSRRDLWRRPRVRGKEKGSNLLGQRWWCLEWMRGSAWRSHRLRIVTSGSGKADWDKRRIDAQGNVET